LALRRTVCIADNAASTPAPSPLSQHGYLPHHGTDTANVQLLNTLETTWDTRRPLYGYSWGMSKVFDSVSKPLIVLCWQRLGLPAKIAQWLVNQDANGYTIVRTPMP